MAIRPEDFLSAAQWGRVQALFPELQAEYCAVPDSGKCPCYNVGDEFLFCRNDERDDYWHMGAGTLVKNGAPALRSTPEVSTLSGLNICLLASFCA